MPSPQPLSQLWERGKENISKLVNIHQKLFYGKSRYFVIRWIRL